MLPKVLGLKPCSHDYVCAYRPFLVFQNFKDNKIIPLCMAQVFIQMEDALQCNQLHKNTVKHNSHYKIYKSKSYRVEKTKNGTWDEPWTLKRGSVDRASKIGSSVIVVIDDQTPKKFVKKRRNLQIIFNDKGKLVI